jgi:hypothetical protein
VVPHKRLVVTVIGDEDGGWFLYVCTLTTPGCVDGTGIKPVAGSAFVRWRTYHAIERDQDHANWHACTAGSRQQGIVQS